MRDEPARPINLSDYRPCDYKVDEIALAFVLEPDNTRVRNTSTVRRAGGPQAPLILNGVNLQLERLAINGAPLAAEAYAVEPERLIIHNPPEAFTLEIETIIRPAANTALEGLYVSGGRFCTQCEAEGFRKITYALDRPDSLSRYSTRIEADKAKYPTLLSNGDLTDQGDLPGGRHFAQWRDPHPKPCYLFALVAGDFDSYIDTFVTMSGKTVNLGIHVDKGDGKRAAYAMDCLKRAMKWDEVVFKREYDLEIFNIVAVRDFNFGAMENKGLNVFNSAYVLADPDTATDADYEAIESIVAHEYFHNWTGNRITLRDWFQLCLKEGLTVFRDQEFSADQRSRPVQRIKDVMRLRARQFPEDAGPLAHPVRPKSFVKIDNFYTATVYDKGAEVIRMLKNVLGDDGFAKGAQLYFNRCDGTAATVEDFIACFEEASGRDLRPFMVWYNQAGTPKVKAKGVYDAANKTYDLTISQAVPPTPGQSEKSPAIIPLKIGFISEDGAILAAKRAGERDAREEHALVLDKSEISIRFEGMVRAPIPALAHGFPAPVIIEDGLSAKERLAQMAHDPDAYTRWEAGQALAREAILARAAALKAGATPDKLDAFVAALSREIDRAQEDEAFAALALRLPDLPELIQISPIPDPDLLFEAREGVRKEIAARLREKLEPLAARKGDAEFSASASAAGRRALKSSALALLASLGADAEPLLVKAFETAGTMTEQMASLAALGASGLPAFDAALETFQGRWSGAPNIMDKWFSVQAGAARADAIARIKALRAHPAFDIKNPNRVRSLAMSMASNNPRAFHAADGSGYEFLAGLAGEVDALNPALAARLLGAFESWKRFDPARQAKARAALEAVAAKPDLSKNASEIIALTLG